MYWQKFLIPKVPQVVALFYIFSFLTCFFFNGRTIKKIWLQCNYILTLFILVDMKLPLIQCWLMIYTLLATQQTLVEKPQLLGEGCTTRRSGIPQPELSNDFERKTLKPWVDASEDGSFWAIGSFSAEENNMKSSFISPPPAKDGKYFIYLKNYFDVFGVGILQTENFIALPGDQLSFSFWMYSALSQINNIKVDFITTKAYVSNSKRQLF